MKYSVFIKIIDLKYRGCCSITHDNREYIMRRQCVKPQLFDYRNNNME